MHTEMIWIRDFEETEEILKSKSFYPTISMGPSAPIMANTLIALHGEAHLYRRRTEILMFSRPALMSYELELVRPALRESVAESLNGGTKGKIAIQDVMRFALLRVSARIVGLDGVDTTNDTEALRSMAERLGEGNSSDWTVRDVNEVMREALVARDELRERFFLPSWSRRVALLERYKAGELTAAELPNDLLMLLLKAYEEWDTDQLLRECIFYLGASASTTTQAAPHVLFETLNWIANHPEDAGKVDDIAFLRQAVHETLRLHPPVPALLRAPLEDVVLSSGRSLRKDEYIALDLNSANRRTDVFGADAEEFNPYRTPRKGVHGYGESFGAGPHVCPGRLVAVGAAAAVEKDADDSSIGVLVRLMEELFRYDVKIDPADPPLKRTDTQADRYANFSVLIEERG
ncbi:MAG: cytochrome [Pseudonocardiales bacterium]|nr:cytochrome [Pseudonocardiales bacterium]